MAKNELKIILGGLVAPSLIQATQQAARNLQDLGRAATTTDRGLSGINPAAAVATRGVDTLSASTNSAAANLKKVVPGANQAGNALTNLGRVAQDLPFGFVGIQNNLNPLLESFQRLKAETGSSGAAFKALGSSLIGAGGIGLALSAVSAGFLIFQNGIAGFNSKAKEAKSSADELVKAIKSISLIQGQATASVQGEIATVTSLARVVSDSNKPYHDRKQALQQLKDINKDYFNDLKVEDAATGKLTKTIEEYTKAIIATAITKQFAQEIGELASKIAKSDEDVAKARLKRQQAADSLAKAEKAAANSPVNSRTGELTKAASDASQARRDALDAEADAVKGLSIANETNTKLRESQLLLQNKLNAAQEQAIAITKTGIATGKEEEDSLKKRRDALLELGRTRENLIELARLEVKIINRDAIKNGFKKEEIQQLIDNVFAELFPGSTIFLGTKFKANLKIETVEVSTPDVAGKTLPEGKMGKGVGEGIAKNINEGVEDKINITPIISSAVSTLTETIGSIVANGGGVGELFAGIFQSIAQAFQDFGKALVAYGIALEAVKIGIENPFAAIAAGIGLVAAGALLKKAIPKFADGGIVTGPTLGLVGEAGREAIIPLDRLPQLMSQMAGANTERQQLQVVLQPSIKFSGDSFQVMLNRVNKSKSQLG